MDLQLTGRRALVTGSSSGIGAGIVRMLAEEGCKVVVHGRDRERAEAIAAEIGAAGVALGDLATDEGADATIETARKALDGSVEILINNAGGGSGNSTSQAFMDVTLDHWIATYQSNTLAAMRMIERCVPAMSDALFGRVIQISSAVGVQPNNLGPSYSSAKAAMNNMTVSLAGALKGKGITVNTVSPGVIITPAMLSWGRSLAKNLGWGDPSPDELERLIATERLNLPAGRIGRVEDIAMMVCLLASPRSGYITGANHRIDGGQIRSVN
ncbi:MAG: SDR family oxidoreductase [Novosphingobium sp.]|nr:SDR family oxidoreductase [Novosphingobium sp.]